MKERAAFGPPFYYHRRHERRPITTESLTRLIQERGDALSGPTEPLAPTGDWGSRGRAVRLMKAGAVTFSLCWEHDARFAVMCGRRRALPIFCPTTLPTQRRESGSKFGAS
jgi:hypothetical protein